jgi:hypothetical protein
MGRKRKNNKIPKVHKEMEGLDLRINEFGEIVSNLDIDKVNKFLTETVPDKKLINRYDDKYQQEFKEVLGDLKDEDEEKYEIAETEEVDEMESLQDADDLGFEEDIEDLEKLAKKKKGPAKGLPLDEDLEEEI